jgi:4-oxalocrotonate tautomerase
LRNACPGESAGSAIRTSAQRYEEVIVPLIIVKMLEGRTVEQKRGLATAITEAVVTHTGAPADQVDVIIEDYPRTNWAKAGTLYSDR